MVVDAVFSAWWMRSSAWLLVYDLVHASAPASLGLAGPLVPSFELKYRDAVVVDDIEVQTDLDNVAD
jgi:hypothetical protein